MARDITYWGTASELTGITNYVSSWNVTETGGSTAYVKLRDSLPLATAPSAVDGAAGNVTVGLHMIAVTWVTLHGESLLGTLVEFTAAGSKIATVTIPVAASSRDTMVGRRIYVTKAGAPATGVTPTIAQWFLIVADPATTLAAGMNNLYLPQSSITVASTTGFAATNGRALVTTGNGVQAVSYTSVDATHLLGCTGGTGVMSTGGAVTQPMVGDNTTTTYSWNTADGSLTATNPPTKSTAGHRVETAKLASGTSVGQAYGPNVAALDNGGGLYIEVNSGAVEWTVRGQ